MEKHTVKIPVYEGPLDLLLALIAKNEVDIYDIPIFTITEQYLQYIYTLNDLNIDVASEFIVMAAKLIQIKSKLLLPQSEEDEEQPDPREELIQKLLEYKLYKEACINIKNNEDGYYHTLTREPIFLPDRMNDNTQLNINSLILSCALKKLLEKRGLSKEDNFDTYTIEAENFTIEEKMVQVLNLTQDLEHVSFFSLLDNKATKGDIIVTFLAILELLKLNKVTLKQSKNFDDILIEKAVS